MKKIDKGIISLISMLILMAILATYDVVNNINASKAIESEPEAIIISIKSTEQPIIIIDEATPTEAEYIEPEPEYISLGEYKLTAYCPCKICCGKWSGGKTASGTTPTAGRTIAVDKNVIPFGSVVKIDDVEYVAEDTGNFKGKHIDIYFNSHSEALKFGVQRKEVYLKNGN